MDLFDLLLDSVELTNEMDDSEIEELDEY